MDIYPCNILMSENYITEIEDILISDDLMFYIA